MVNYSETYAHARVFISPDEHIHLCPSWLSVPGVELWPSWIRIVLNIIALAYLFVGIAVTSETFMFSIERITSTRRKVRSYDIESGMHVEREVFIWNETVANLTLMALGSSAPEILLACIEEVRSINNPPVETPDSLGLFTIIGSAAFNLFVISGICILTITSPFIKKIEKFGVFLLTSFFSILAYGWMLVITILISPEIIELWEAILTFMFFPLMVIFAYAQDNDWWIRRGINLRSGTEKVKATENASTEDKDKRMTAGENEKQEEPVGLNHPEEPKGSLTESSEMMHKHALTFHLMHELTDEQMHPKGDQRFVGEETEQLVTVELKTDGHIRMISEPLDFYIILRTTTFLDKAREVATRQTVSDGHENQLHSSSIRSFTSSRSEVYSAPLGTPSVARVILLPVDSM
ncbi:hypothetical protein EG68_06324 [Paragonimus skrjabini miyazakii]|uniref:Sodium/calcium exchanger membrane region domain-containing protein n=1 Tax=Paragonimus skrjabini miyazakii TaxID=59628 RepID=A0A8S9YQ70_9TREM|nr:hypothetical protein EG68_06324 [Paragonimus skrjabini miyazakii]